jgi:hypothetical protein
MSRIKLVAACLAAFFVVSVASASATQPVFYGVAAIGSVVGPVKESGTLGAAFLEGKTSKTKISCTAGTSTSEVVTATKGINGLVTFTGCESGGLPCQNEGSGVIKTVPLEGVLGNISATVPGERVFAPGESGKSPKTGALATFECAGGAAKVVVSGSVLGSLSGAQGKTPEEGKFAASAKLTYAETAGTQKYLSFLPGECGGNANDCGPEQLTSTINGTPELGGQSVIATLKTVPFASKLGFTK